MPPTSAIEPIVLPYFKVEEEAAEVQQKQTTEGSDELLDAWVANRLKINEEIQCLAKGSPQQAKVMDELVEEKSAPEDRAFSLYRRSQSS